METLLKSIIRQRQVPLKALLFCSRWSSFVIRRRIIFLLFQFHFQSNFICEKKERSKGLLLSLPILYLRSRKKRIEYHVNSWWRWTVHLFKWAFTSINLFISFFLLLPISLHDNKRKGKKEELQFNRIKTRERCTRKKSRGWEESESKEHRTDRRLACRLRLGKSSLSLLS